MADMSRLKKTSSLGAPPPIEEASDNLNAPEHGPAAPVEMPPAAVEVPKAAPAPRKTATLPGSRSQAPHRRSDAAPLQPHGDPGNACYP